MADENTPVWSVYCDQARKVLADMCSSRSSDEAFGRVELLAKALAAAAAAEREWWARSIHYIIEQELLEQNAGTVDPERTTLYGDHACAALEDIEALTERPIVPPPPTKQVRG